MSARCPLCQDTGYLRAGIVVHQDWHDDQVEWVAELISCTHPPASSEIPAETDTNRLTVVGARRPEGRDGPDVIGPVPASGGAS